MSKNNIELKIKGMTCTACKEKIEKAMARLDGVVVARVMLESNLAEVQFNPEIISMDKIKDTIEALDYEVVSDVDKRVSETKKKETIEVITISIAVVILYLVIDKTIGFNFIPDVTDQMSLLALFVVGLFTSLHCLSMCGGINLSTCAPKKIGDSRMVPSVAYNLGRVISYTLLGGIIGGIGSVVSFSTTIKGIIALLAGIFMIIMGLNMLNILPILRKITPRMPLFLRKIVSTEKPGRAPFVVGLLNVFIPCGPLQAMQIYALGTGSIVMGALSMFFFSLGTVPLMFGFGTLGAFFGSKFTHKMIKVSGALVIILGLVMAGRGLSLSGHLSHFSNNTPKDVKIEDKDKGESESPTIIDGTQVVVSDLKYGAYYPINVKANIPVKWIINAKEEEINGCNEVLVIPAFDIEKKLVPGENIIEFTPNEEGIIPYSCWMGMIRSKITVLPNQESNLNGGVTISNSSNNAKQDEGIVKNTDLTILDKGNTDKLKSSNEKDRKLNKVQAGSNKNAELVACEKCGKMNVGALCETCGENSSDIACEGCSGD